MIRVLSKFKMFALIVFVLLLAACDPIARKTQTSTAIVGTKTIIKASGRELTSEITEVDGKYVTVETSDWKQKYHRVMRMYRGLFPVSGVQVDGQYEYDFDERKLEELFPLEVGGKAHISGTFMHLEENSAYPFSAHFKVIGTKKIALSSGNRDVFKIRVNTEFEFDDNVEHHEELLYFDAENDLILKLVYESSSAKYTWRVVSLVLPGDGKSVPDERRRSGTVMI